MRQRDHIRHLDALACAQRLQTAQHRQAVADAHADAAVAAELRDLGREKRELAEFNLDELHTHDTLRPDRLRIAGQILLASDQDYALAEGELDASNLVVDQRRRDLFRSQRQTDAIVDRGVWLQRRANRRDEENRSSAAASLGYLLKERTR